MEKQSQPKTAARALLTFDNAGDLKDVFLIGSSPDEEALAEKGIRNALKPAWMTKVSSWVRGRP